MIKKTIKLMSHKLYPDKNNLYDDIYVEKVSPVDEIKKLQKNTQANFLKIGRMLLYMLDGKFIEYRYELFAYYFEDIKHTQILKYIEAYNYANLKYQNNQPIDSCLKLGIEKLYLITRLESQEKREKLEQFVLDNKLTVKQLNSLVKVLNGKSEILKFAQKFEELTKPNNEIQES